MKNYWADILITLGLFIGVWFTIGLNEEFSIPELHNNTGEQITLNEPFLIHFWSTWSKPSQRDIQVLQRFVKKHPEIQLIGVTSSEEEETKLRDLKLNMGIYYPQATTTQFPQSIPLTVIQLNGEQIIIDESLQYESLLAFFDKQI